MTESIAVPLPDGGFIDHVVLGVPDTHAAADELGERFGLRPNVSDVEGADYPTLSGGLGLGHESFFELFGPNPTYDGPPHFLRDLVAALPGPRLLTFMVRVSDLPAAIERLGESGVVATPALSEWERTNAASFRNAQFPDHALDPAVPRLIEWNERLGMDDRLIQGVTLRQLTVRTDDLDRVDKLHRLLGLDRAQEIRLEEGRPGISVTLDTPNGVVTI